MNFELTDGQERFREEVRDFLGREVLPKIGEAEEHDQFSIEIFRKGGDYGLLGVLCPREYGGRGLDNICGAIMGEEMGRVSIGICITILVHAMGVLPIFVQLANQEQIRKFVIPAIRGQKLMAIGMTEPNAGSDFGGIETTARHENGQFVINGSKIFITNGNHADLLLAAVVTREKTKVHNKKGISLIVVEKGTPGFSSSRQIEKLGWRGSDTAELYFDDCRVPQQNILGEENQGYFYIMEILDISRITFAAVSVGIVQGTFEESLRIAREKKKLMVSFNNYQGIRFVLADMATRVEAARKLVYWAARLKDQGMKVSIQSSMAKLFASEVANWGVRNALQIYGQRGMLKEYSIERYFRDARAMTIAEGTSEIQREIIAKQLGL